MASMSARKACCSGSRSVRLMFALLKEVRFQDLRLLDLHYARNPTAADLFVAPLQVVELHLFGVKSAGA